MNSRATIITAPAKITLTLDILGIDERDQMHFLNTLSYISDNFTDELKIEYCDSNENELSIHGPHAFPVEKSNTILRALELLGLKGVRVELKKNIPLQSGLGGGSSNAAAILKHFGALKGIPLHDLQVLGAQIGADVPLFLTEDNLVYCEGYGDQVVQSWRIDPINIQLLETGVQVSTERAYAQLELSTCGKHSVKTEALLRMLNEGENVTPLLLKPYLHNDFEASFFQQNPSWQEKGHLSGSGGMLWNFSQ